MFVLSSLAILDVDPSERCLYCWLVCLNLCNSEWRGGGQSSRVSHFIQYFRVPLHLRLAPWLDSAIGFSHFFPRQTQRLEGGSAPVLSSILLG